MKRVIQQLPVDIPGQKGKSTDVATQVSSLCLFLKKRTSLKPQFQNSLKVDLKKIHKNIDELGTKIISLILEYDAHCEQQEQEIVKRKDEDLEIQNLV